MIAPLIALVASAATPSGLAGVWQGEIGTLPVRACFTTREWGTFGAYYYLSRLRTIPLEAAGDAGNVFSEAAAGDEVPRWQIERVAGAQLTGRWTQGRRTLPLRFSRVAGGEGEDGPCASMAFHQPRLEGVRSIVSRASVDGTAYSRIALDPRGRFELHYTTFALDGSSEAVRRINAAVGEGLAGDPPHWLECSQLSFAAGPNEGSFDESLEPAMISRRWLSVAHHWDGFCGGAHPDSSNTYRLFDLTSGAEVDLHDWLTSAAVKREHFEGVAEDSKTLLPAFRTLILEGWRPEDPECDETVRGEEYWNIGLGREGMIFSPSIAHAAQVCWEQITVPFARLRPFLTPEGAANVQALQNE